MPYICCVPWTCTYLYISNCNVCLRIINVMSPSTAYKFMNLPRFHFIYHHFGIMKTQKKSYHILCGADLAMSAALFCLPCFTFARCSRSVCIRNGFDFRLKIIFSVCVFFSFFIPATRPNMPTIAISYFLCSQIGNCISNETLFLFLFLWFRSQKNGKSKKSDTIHKPKFLKNNKRRQYVGVLCVFVLVLGFGDNRKCMC